MSDDKSKTAPQDASKVNVNQDYEVAYWCKKFNCTKAQLIKAVANVGVMANDVEKEVKRLKNLNRGMGM